MNVESKFDSSVSASAARVAGFLRQQGGDFEVKHFPESTRSAAEAAATIGCEIAQIAKSLIFKNVGDDSAVLVVASGRNRVDTNKITAISGIKLSRADADFVREKIGYAIGGVPPIAHATPLTCFLDQDLCQCEILWAAAGTPNSVFSLTPQQLQSFTNGRWINLSE